MAIEFITNAITSVFKNEAVQEAVAPSQQVAVARTE